MTNNYYQETLDKIMELIDDDMIQEATYLLEQELSQTFIPKKYEEAFHGLYQEIKEEDSERQSLSLITEEELLHQLLQGELEEQVLALLNIEQLNIRNYLNIVQEYLLSSQDPLIKARMLELCAMQGVRTELKYQQNGDIQHVVPATLGVIAESEVIQVAFEKLDQGLMKNPSALEIAKHLLVEQLYLIYPQTVVDKNLDVLVDDLIAEAINLLNQ